MSEGRREHWFEGNEGEGEQKFFFFPTGKWWKSGWGEATWAEMRIKIGTIIVEKSELCHRGQWSVLSELESGTEVKD